MANTSHLAELEISSTDVVAVWNALEPVVARCAGSLGAPALKSTYSVGHSDNPSTVTGADLDDCLDRVDSPTLISVTYAVQRDANADPSRIELKIMRYRHFKELNVHLRVTGPTGVQTLGFFERSRATVTRAIDRFTAS